MYRIILRVASALVVLSGLAECAAACNCTPDPPPCLAFQSTPVVFAGLVKSIEEQRVEISRFGKKETIRVGLTAHFLVEEAFKGIRVSEVDVVTGGGGGDCGYGFLAGERYLVYAYRSGSDALGSSVSRTVIGGGNPSARRDALSASICSRTRSLSRAQDDLELLRALTAGKPQTRIFGVVSEFARRLGRYEYHIDEVGPMAGVIIRAEGPRGKYEKTTDNQGYYRFVGITPGKYKITIVFPENYGSLFDFVKNEVQVDVTSQGCSAEADFDLQIDGRITGRVFDEQGRPVGKQVQVSIVTIESADKGIPLVESRSDYTDNDGRYAFEGVVPGRYVLGVNIADAPDKGTPFPRTYYPTGNELSKAMIISIAKGQKVRDLDLHLPPQLVEHTITGVVLLASGKPAVGVDVDLYDSENPQSSLFGVDVKTDAQGRFAAKCYKGRKYQLHSYLDEDYFAGKGLQSEIVEVDTRDATQSIILVLNKSGIFRQ